MAASIPNPFYNFASDTVCHLGMQYSSGCEELPIKRADNAASRHNHRNRPDLPGAFFWPTLPGEGPAGRGGAAGLLAVPPVAIAGNAGTGRIVHPGMQRRFSGTS